MRNLTIGRNKFLRASLGTGLVGIAGMGWAPAALALAAPRAATVQTAAVPMVMSAPAVNQVGPMVGQPLGLTRTWSVPMAFTLPAGSRLMTGDLQLGSTGISPVYAGAPGLALGVVGNGLNLHVDSALSDVTEVGAGIAANASAPWRGHLDVEAKRAIAREGIGGVPLSLSAMAGAVFEVNANGVPDIGLQVGLPITKVFSFTGANYVAFSLDPNWNLGAMGAQAGMPARGINSLGLGFGVDLALNEAAHFLADTNLGLAIGGVQSSSAVGFRYAFNPAFIGEVFLGVGGGAFGTGASGLGVGATLRY